MSYEKVPQWIKDSKTDITEQNDEVGLIVAGYIGAFVKRGFSQQEMGSLMASAFLLPLSEVEKRIDEILSLTDDNEQAKKLCTFCVQKGKLFSNEDTDPCEIIKILNNKYGKEATLEVLLHFPEILHLWKNKEVRHLPENEIFNKKTEKILYECSTVFEEIN